MSKKSNSWVTNGEFSVRRNNRELLIHKREIPYFIILLNKENMEFEIIPCCDTLDLKEDWPKIQAICNNYCNLKVFANLSIIPKEPSFKESLRLFWEEMNNPSDV